MKLFLGGDLMIARGVDQVLPWPVDPILHESYVRDARDYVRIAERRSGPIPRSAELACPWVDALEVLDDEAPDVRIVNLETSITDRGAPDPQKGVHYRVSPRTAATLSAAARRVRAREQQRARLGTGRAPVHARDARVAREDARQDLPSLRLRHRARVRRRALVFG